MGISINLNTSSIIRSNTTLQERRLTTGSKIITDVAVTKEYNLNNDCVQKIQFSDTDTNATIINLRNNSLGTTDTERPLQNISLLRSLERIDISGNGMSTTQINNFVDDLYNSAQINALRNVVYNISNNATPDVDQLTKLLVLQSDYGFVDSNYATIKTNQSVLTGVNISILGDAGKTILIEWGDALDDTVVLSGGLDTITHNYVSTGTYNIVLKNDIGFISLLSIGDNEGIEELYANELINCKGYQIKNNLLTIAELPQIAYNGGLIDFYNNAIIDTDTIVININQNTPSPGNYVDVSGGTNAPLTATGLAAKASLITKGWTVTNN